MTFDGLFEPGRFAPAVIATDDASLTETALDVNGRQVVLQAWPDDPEWTGFVGSQIAAGLTELESLIGFPIRDDAATRRAGERPSRSSRGSPAGTTTAPASSRSARISTQAWCSTRSATPGSTTTSARLGGSPRASPRHTPTSCSSGPAGPSVRRSRRPRDGPGSLALDEWVHPNGFALDAAVEQYGYETSYFVVDSVVDEIGIDRMGDVLAAVEGDLEAYRGDAQPQPVDVATDWRRLLDLLEEVAGSGGAAELFRTYVASADDLAAIDQRAAARQRYAALVDDGAGWAAPDVVRQAMEAGSSTSPGTPSTRPPQCSPHGRRCRRPPTRRASTCRRSSRRATSRPTTRPVGRPATSRH